MMFEINVIRNWPDAFVISVSLLSQANCCTRSFDGFGSIAIDQKLYFFNQDIRRYA